jgi:Holliday junction resolvase
MAMTPEAKVKKRVKEMLDHLEIYHFSPPGMGLGRSGIPDLICCANGHFVAIECKAGKGQTTALQERELNAITIANGHVFVARESNLEELYERLIWIIKNLNDV